MELVPGEVFGTVAAPEQRCRAGLEGFMKKLNGWGGHLARIFLPVAENQPLQTFLR